MKKRITSVLLATSVMLAGLLGACGNSATTTQAAAGGEVVTLKVFAAWPENNTNLVDYQKFIDKVDEKSNGTVKIEWGGGPEAIPSYQLVESIKSGLVDIAWTAHTYNVSHIPVLEGVKLTDGAEMRANGGFEYLDKLYQEKLNAHYLGLLCDGLTYNLYSQKEIKSLEDFKGMTVRATPAYQDFVASLGAGVSNMAPTEAYQALERSVIQGFGWPSIGIMDFGWQEVSKYIIEPGFYNVDTCIVLGNGAWDKLNDVQRKALQDAALEIEVEAVEYYKGATAADHEKLVAAGMEVITFPEDVAKVYLQMAYDAGWKAVEKNAPADAATLRGFVGK